MDFDKDEKKDLRREQIVLLVKTFYNKFDFLKYESLDLLIDKALSLFLDSDLSIEEISDKLLEAVMERKKDLDSRYDNEKIKNNHEDLYGKLERVFSLMNSEGIDCQLAGSLCGYIKYGEEADRSHDDIDIYLNEDDMSKFRKVCINLGLMFEDNRLNSPRSLKDGNVTGEHEVIAKNSDNDFHIGVSCFKRNDDGSVVSKDYYHDNDGNPCVREEVLSPSLASQIFSGEEVDFRGTPITITPPEYVYILKEKSDLKKDNQDIEFLDSKIDKDKMMRIKSLTIDERIVQNVPVGNIFDSNVSNPYSESSDDDLGMMLADDEGGSKDKGSESSKGNGKVLIKTNPDVSHSESHSDEGGFASSGVLSTISIIAFLCAAIAFMAIYLIKG